MNILKYNVDNILNGIRKIKRGDVMFMERMALEEKLRRERLTCFSEARTFQGLRPYRRAPRWQVWLFTRLGEWLVAWGTSLQQRYRRAEARLALPEYSRHDGMEQML